jgi:hypothetical protein
MKRLIMLILMLLVAAPAYTAAPLRVYVAEFNAVGAQAKDDTKLVLQSLLASRISNEKLLAVATAAEAEVVVTGTYISIGKQYNIDAVAKTAGGQTVTRTFVQGEGGQEALFSAVPKLADKLSADLSKQLDAGSISRLVVAPAAVAVVAAPPKPGSPDIVRAATAAPVGDLQHAPKGDVIRSQAIYHGSPSKGVINRLDGMFNLMAPAGHDTDGKRLFFLAQDRSVQLVKEGDSYPKAGFSLDADQQIISLDYLDVDGSGVPKLFVTVVKMSQVASQIWTLKDKRLVKIADKVPYFFRALALAGGPVKLYAQEQGIDAERFYGDVYQVTLKGATVVKQQKFAMPRYGNIYSFNQFKHASGQLFTVVYDTDNHLVVYGPDFKELWRSNDSFGNSELFYQVDDPDRYRTTGDKYRWYFMNTPIQVTAQQNVLVARNDGFWAVGNARRYKRGAVYNLFWNGASLEEVWRTKDTQNYMPDFYFDEAKSELVLLQLTQRNDLLLLTKGASALQIKKVE